MPDINELKAKAAPFKGKPILIALRGAPDPDSISSSLALKNIFSLWDIESIVLYSHEISHQENKALVKLLDIDLVFYRNDFKFEHEAVVFVDAHKSDDVLADLLKDKPILAIIDHHDFDPGNAPQADFLDIRKNVGSTATIAAEYLRDLDFFKKDNQEHKNLATALMHGIRSDTNNYMLAMENDFMAMAYLSRFASLSLLEQISRQQLAPSTMEIVSSAYQKKEIVDNYLISFVGVVRREDRDAIPQAADYLLRRAGIDTVLVFGIVGEYIDCSLRTNSDVITPDRFIRESFPEVVAGTYGGRFDKGGFLLPLGIFAEVSGGENTAVLSELVDRFVKSQFYAKLGTDNANVNSKLRK